MNNKIWFYIGVPVAAVLFMCLQMYVYQMTAYFGRGFGRYSPRIGELSAEVSSQGKLSLEAWLLLGFFGLVCMTVLAAATQTARSKRYVNFFLLIALIAGTILCIADFSTYTSIDNAYAHATNNPSSSGELRLFYGLAFAFLIQLFLTAFIHKTNNAHIGPTASDDIL